MNTKMAINSQLSTIESEKQTKQIRTDRNIISESIVIVTIWEEGVEDG